MKLTLSTLLLLLVIQHQPTYGQTKPKAKKVVAPSTSPPDLLGEPVSPCGCFLPCPEIDSLQVTYACVEQMPKPPYGSIRAYLDTLTKQVRIPANQPRLEGRVWVKFVVTPTGQLTDFVVTKGLSPTYDAAAIQVFQLQPPWTPGYQNGHAVRVRIHGYVLFPPQ